MGSREERMPEKTSLDDSVRRIKGIWRYIPPRSNGETGRRWLKLMVKNNDDMKMTMITEYNNDNDNQ